MFRRSSLLIEEEVECEGDPSVDSPELFPSEEGKVEASLDNPADGLRDNVMLKETREGSVEIPETHISLNNVDLVGLYRSAKVIE